MKGVVFVDKGNIVVKDDLPKPNLLPNEVMVKPKYCGICGSCIESYKYGGMYLPGIIIGHEFSGDVVQVGDNVKNLKVGDRVSIDPNTPCNDCYWCNRNQENMCRLTNYALGTTHNGGMAEFINVRSDHAHIMPDSMSYKAGATVEPLGNCLYGIQESGFKIGDNATIFGAGTIGLMTLQALKAAGASDIFVLEPVEFKQKKALELGATEAFNPKNWNKIIRNTGKIGPDYIFDCVGNPDTVMMSLNLVKRGGKITLIGIHVEPFEMKGLMRIPLRNITLRGVFGFTPDIFKASLKFIAEKKVNGEAIVTNTIKIDEVPRMFEKLAKPLHEEIKVLVEID